MKLYLSSFGLGNQPDHLRKLVNGNNALIILNALDHNETVRSKFLKSQTEELNQLGFKVSELDLRDYFGKANQLEDLISNNNVVWINGGNTFILRKAMKLSGFDKIITGLLTEDKIVYGGFSAAVVVLHKDLHGLDITDDPNQVPNGYPSKTVWDGLGLLDFSVAVHYESDHPESHLTDQEIEYYKEHNIPYKTLRDGEVILINNDHIEILN